MAIDETRTRPKSTNVSSTNRTQTEHARTNTPARLGYLLARKQRIERWAYKGRSSSINDTSTTASASLGAVSAQKRSESSFSQAGRVLNLRLLQLSEQRQKSIDQSNFDQKLFANKQALKYKDNQAVLKTLSYVRKCCKFADQAGSEENSIDPKIFLEEHARAKRSRSRSRSPTATPPPIKRTLSANARSQTSASLTETFLQHNKRHLQSSPINRKPPGSQTTSITPTVAVASESPAVDDDTQKRHVQFRINPNGTHISSQSAHVLGKSRSCHLNTRTTTSAQGIRSSDSLSYETRSSNSAPAMLSTNEFVTEEHEKSSPKIKRSLSRVTSAKNSLQEFRLHPERFLSSSNRYLPLLLRQVGDVDSKERKQQQRTHFSPPISRLSDGSDLTYDDAKSFLSEENEISKNTPRSQPSTWLEHDRKSHKKLRSPTKINMMETVNDDTSERTMALARLRDREYAHLQDLIRSTPFEHILEPFSAITTDDDNSTKSPRPKRLVYKQATTTVNSSLKARQLGDILRSIDSLRCSDTIDRHARRQVDLEKNRAKLGILIF